MGVQLFIGETPLCSPEMKQQLLSGTTVVVDRYAFSGVAYTAAKEVRCSNLCVYILYTLYELSSCARHCWDITITIGVHMSTILVQSSRHWSTST